MTNHDERTPLLKTKSRDSERVEGGPGLIRSLKRAFGVENRILLAGFLITLSFSYTQVP